MIHARAFKISKGYSLTDFVQWKEAQSVAVLRCEAFEQDACTVVELYQEAIFRVRRISREAVECAAEQQFIFANNKVSDNFFTCREADSNLGSGERRQPVEAIRSFWSGFVNVS